jgi:hypothetical protein
MAQALDYQQQDPYRKWWHISKTPAQTGFRRTEILSDSKTGTISARRAIELFRKIAGTKYLSDTTDGPDGLLPDKFAKISFADGREPTGGFV